MSIPETPVIHLLCAGAAKGLVLALQAGFEAEHRARIEPTFGAVGALKEALLAGAACDLMLVTAALLDELCGAGWLRADTVAALGRVHTGIAVRAGMPLPDVATPEALKATLLAAPALYFPDPARATAGIHFAGVLRQLGIHATLAPRFRTFENGATSMRELAADTEASAAGVIGCTQVTEINYSAGVTLVGVLPQRFELATVYSAALGRAAAEPVLAARLLALLTGPASQGLRAAGGFES